MNSKVRTFMAKMRAQYKDVVIGCRLQGEDTEFRERTKAKEQVKVSEQQQRVQVGTGQDAAMSDACIIEL